jgi:YD repeat-containing protein
VLSYCRRASCFFLLATAFLGVTVSPHLQGSHNSGLRISFAAPAYAAQKYLVETYSASEKLYPDFSLGSDRFPLGYFHDSSLGLQLPIVQYVGRSVGGNVCGVGFLIATVTLISVDILDHVPPSGPLVPFSCPGNPPSDFVYATYIVANPYGERCLLTPIYTIIPLLPKSPAQSLKSKNLGDCANPCDPATPPSAEGNPINAATGNKYQAETDFVGGAATALSLTRYYNSQDQTGSAFGSRWHSTWHRGLTVSQGALTVTATRADGREFIFTRNGAAGASYVGDADVMDRLSRVPPSGRQAGWQLITAVDTVETYTLAGLLTAVTTRTGLVTRLTYDARGRLTQVTGPFGDRLTFLYDALNRVSQMTAPDDSVYHYAYDAKNNLASVNYPDGSIRKYLYTNTAFPNALTGIIDENGARFAS